jgi:hypothetical protein
MLRYFVVPCCKNKSPDIMRRTLRSCDEYEDRKFTFIASDKTS